VDETDAIPAQDSRLRSHHLHFEWSYKRLEKGRFRWPAVSSNDDQARSITMRAEELAMLVNGLDVKHTKQRNWYRKSV
jgi:transposase